MTTSELKLEAQIRAQEWMVGNWLYFARYSFDTKATIHLTQVHCQMARWAECWVSEDGINYEPRTVHKIYWHRYLNEGGLSA